MQSIPSQDQALLNLGKINGWIDSSPVATVMRHSMANLAFELTKADLQVEIDIGNLLSISDSPITSKRFKKVFLDPLVGNDYAVVLQKVHQQIFAQSEGYQFQPGQLRSENTPGQIQGIINKIDESSDSPFAKALDLHKNFLDLKPFNNGNEIIAALLPNIYLTHRGVMLAPILSFHNFPAQGDDADEWFQDQTNLIITLLHEIRDLEQEYKSRTNGFATQRKKLFSGLLPFMMKRPKFTIQELLDEYGQSTYQTINELFKDLVKLNVLKELTGNARFRVFHLHEYSNLFKTIV